MNRRKARLIVALDVDTFDEAKGLIAALSDDVEIFKVGSQLFTACGPVIVQYLLEAGKKVFLGDCPRMGFPENRVLKINKLQHKNLQKSYSWTVSLI